MNREDIIKLAREAGFTEGDISLFPDLIAHFAAIVAAAEREECAKACEELLTIINSGDEHMDGVTDCIVAIRARGEK